MIFKTGCKEALRQNELSFEFFSEDFEGLHNIITLRFLTFYYEAFLPACYTNLFASFLNIKKKECLSSTWNNWN